MAIRYTDGRIEHAGRVVAVEHSTDSAGLDGMSYGSSWVWVLGPGRPILGIPVEQSAGFDGSARLVAQWVPVQRAGGQR